MFESLTIKANRGEYTVECSESDSESYLKRLPQKRAIIIDRKVAEIYRDRLQDILSDGSAVLVDAHESNKDIHAIGNIAEVLLKMNIQRDSCLVAVGGGIIQDITCYLASSMFRGLNWYFVPTTLLSQTDSCIGSKSSVNVGQYKNIMGTFWPPQSIHIDLSYQNTLGTDEICSGIGEMIKVHALSGSEQLKSLDRDYENIRTSKSSMSYYIHKSLSIKKQYIEEDEYDKGKRNLLNYGHSFGHAIEAASNFEVPHGIAVTMGMDLANFVAWKHQFGTEHYFQTNHALMKRNSSNFSDYRVPVGKMIEALRRDKKNQGSRFCLILPNKVGTIEKTFLEDNANFIRSCEEYLEQTL